LIFMKDKSISENTCERIEREKITPIPKWHFVLKNYSIWSFAIFSLFIGGAGTAVTLFRMRTEDWDLLKYVEGGFLKLFLVTMPYVWIAVVTLFLVVAYYNFKHTPYGYRRKPIYIFIVSLIVSFVVGVSAYAMGVGEALENYVQKNVPVYSFISPKHRVWNNPQRGLLAGVVVSRDGNLLLVQDFTGKEWEVEISAETVIKPRIRDLSPGIYLKFVGTSREKSFLAREIRPFGGGFRADERKRDHFSY
jgi:hypothetical protein